MTAMKYAIGGAWLPDDRGEKVHAGDMVRVVVVDSSRGALRWMEQGVVTGVGRTRLLVQFPSMSKLYAIGNECVRLTGTT